MAGIVHKILHRTKNAETKFMVNCKIDKFGSADQVNVFFFNSLI